MSKVKGYSGRLKADELYDLIEQYACLRGFIDNAEDNKVCIDFDYNEYLKNKAEMVLAQIKLLDFISEMTGQKYKINEYDFSVS